MALQLLAVLVLGLMCGSELNMAAFAHPMLNRQPLEVHMPMRASLAVLFGRVMPFWMAGSTLLNFLLLLPFVIAKWTPESLPEDLLASSGWQNWRYRGHSVKEDEKRKARSRQSGPLR
jgi:hypothetical protein